MARVSAAPDPLAALGARLQIRAAALAQEVRDYPTPIARCDEQLSELLERRSRVLCALDALEEFTRHAASAAGRVALQAALGALRPGDLDADHGADLAALCDSALGALRAESRARPGGCGPADAWANDGGTAA